jgi:hypothetical protein
MDTMISSAASAAGRNLAAHGFACKRSHLTETIAALLGYKTHAALVTEEADATLDYHGEDAEFFVLNMKQAAERTAALGLPAEAAQACYDGFAVAANRPVFRDVAEFWDSHVRDELVLAMGNGVDTGESNASYSSDPDLDEWTESGDLWTSPGAWTIEGSGTWSGVYDPEGDRMFNGDTFNVTGKMEFTKAGRAGLIFLDCEVFGGADDSWRGEPEDWM